MVNRFQAVLSISTCAATSWTWTRWRGISPSRTATMGRATRARSCWQGFTLVHFTAQLKRFLWDKGCWGGVQEEFIAGVEGVFRRLEDVLSI
jgi:hypothetical protein